jgi:diguanylate cyclase (GGDEF)-like protein
MKYMDPKRLLFAAMSFIAIVTVFVGIGIWRLREDAISNSLREADSVATILAEQAGHSARAIELVLDELLAKVRGGGNEAEADYLNRIKGIDLFEYLKDRLAQLPQADIITVTDRAGNMLNMSREWPAPVINLAERDYFRYFSTTRDHNLYISEPVIAKSGGLLTIYFVKRLETPDGKFAGIIYIGVRPEYFIRALDVISAVPDRSLILMRRDGLVLTRYPDVSNRAGFKLPDDSPWYKYAYTGGQYFTKGLFENQSRWITVRPVARYPLVIDVGISERQVLSNWIVRAIVIGGCGLLVELLFISLMIFIYRQFVRLRESQQQLSTNSRHIELVKQRFESALSNTTHGIAMFDRAGGLLIKNEKYERILGLHTIEFLFEDGQADGRHANAAHSYLTAGDLVIRALARGGQSNVLSLEDGRSIRVTTESMTEGGWVTTLEDVTESEHFNEKIIRMAHFDGLTKIANRTKFISELREVLSANEHSKCAVLLLDLDRFKEVNDTYGHGLGDELLCSFAQRLIAELNCDDLVARLGGDEFAILCSLAADEMRDLDELAHRLLVVVGAPFQIQSNDISVGLSIGIAIGQSGQTDVEQLMRHADLALYQAKSDGRNCCRFFEYSMEERFHQRKALTIELEQAINHDELVVYYQPIVDATSLEIVSMEALVRWNHPRRGMVSPADFIPLAEECGLIYALGERVLRRACIDASIWPDRVRVAVNVSTMQLNKPTFSQAVELILAETGLPPARLKLEITESVLLSETVHGITTLNALRAQGIAISLDDFGTGYSSLSYLKRFHFDEIKIDKSFVDDLGNSRGSTAIVAATITLARELDIVTTAEGVETEDQRLLLQASGVQQLQGYLFGKPAPASTWTFDGAALGIAPARQSSRAVG